jgi:hypothetical protein
LTVRCQDYGKEYESTKKFSSGLKHFYTILKSHKKNFPINIPKPDKFLYISHRVIYFHPHLQ